MCSQRYKLPIRTRPGLSNDLQSEQEKKEQWQILALAFRKNHNALNPLEQTEREEEKEREREEDAGSVRGVETAQRSCQFHLRSLTRICLHRFLHLVACLLFTFGFFLLSLSLSFGALFLTNFLLNTTWKHFPLREAHIKYHCHVWVSVPVCVNRHTHCNTRLASLDLSQFVGK